MTTEFLDHDLHSHTVVQEADNLVHTNNNDATFLSQREIILRLDVALNRSSGAIAHQCYQWGSVLKAGRDDKAISDSNPSWKHSAHYWLVLDEHRHGCGIDRIILLYLYCAAVDNDDISANFDRPIY